MSLEWSQSLQTWATTEKCRYKIAPLVRQMALLCRAGVSEDVRLMLSSICWRDKRTLWLQKYCVDS
jgi:hypothetical protein